MTLEQVTKLCNMVMPHDVTLYGTPTLEDGKWIIGLKKHRDEMALQVEYADRPLTEAEEYRTSLQLKNLIAGALLLSA